MAYIVYGLYGLWPTLFMAYIVMAYIVYGLHSYGLYSLWPVVAVGLPSAPENTHVTRMSIHIADARVDRHVCMSGQRPGWNHSKVHPVTNPVSRRRRPSSRRPRRRRIPFRSWFAITFFFSGKGHNEGLSGRGAQKKNNAAVGLRRRAMPSLKATFLFFLCVD